MSVTLHLGDCLDVLPSIPDASVDLVLTDPPYPEIDRKYGRWTEAEWWSLIVEGVIPHVRRVLKPHGSAVFILQPNSRKVGSMRGWLFRFQAWACDHWNMVQDAYWWNTSTMPVGGANKHGLMRPSLKHEVWLGPPDCYRDQGAVLLPESESNRRDRIKGDHDRGALPSRVRSETEGPRDDYRRLRTSLLSRGGSTPFNVLPMGSSSPTSAGTHGHGAGTPAALCNWWLRYLTRPGDTVLDPFLGSGTVALEALKLGRSAIGIERMPEYHAIARRRVREAESATPLLTEAAP